MQQKTWVLHLHRGKVFLARHQPQMALKSFEAAMRDCPVEESEDLSKILYLCGIAFQKIGALESARECWHGSSSLNPLGPAESMLKREEHSLQQHWFDFKTIQLARYFEAKKQWGFFSEVEQKRVLEIIGVYWEELAATGILEQMNQYERDCLYHEVTIDFGHIFLPGEGGEECRFLAFKKGFDAF